MKPTRTLVPLAVTVLVTVTGCGSDSSSSGTATTSASSAATTAAASTGAAATSAAASSGASSAASPASSSDATPAIVKAAQAFLATLSAEQKSAVQFDWSNTAQKTRWSNLPQGLYQRSGLMWGDLSTDSQNAWLAVMKATLSTEGYNRVIGEWQADDALAAQGGGGGQIGTKYYWVALIGAPSTSTPWQWQWGGHHVTVNATISGSNLSLTPSFIGIQPGSYDANGQTSKPLGDIWDAAYALVSSLDATQQKTAVLGSQTIDLVLGPGKDGQTIQAEGLAGAKMTDAQKTAFFTLISKYGGLENAEDGAARLAQLKADLDQTYFAWYGAVAASGPAYFRITGPHIVVEYSPQSMGGNAALHIHGIYRDPTDDYGASFAK